MSKFQQLSLQRYLDRARTRLLAAHTAVIAGIFLEVLHSLRSAAGYRILTKAHLSYVVGEMLSGLQDGDDKREFMANVEALREEFKDEILDLTTMIPDTIMDNLHIALPKAVVLDTKVVVNGLGRDKLKDTQAVIDEIMKNGNQKEIPGPLSYITMMGEKFLVSPSGEIFHLQSQLPAQTMPCGGVMVSDGSHVAVKYPLSTLTTEDLKKWLEEGFKKRQAEKVSLQDEAAMEAAKAILGIQTSSDDPQLVELRDFLRSASFVKDNMVRFNTIVSKRGEAWILNGMRRLNGLGQFSDMKVFETQDTVSRIAIIDGEEYRFESIMAGAAIRTWITAAKYRRQRITVYRRFASLPVRDIAILLRREGLPNDELILMPAEVRNYIADLQNIEKMVKSTTNSGSHSLLEPGIEMMRCELAQTAACVIHASCVTNLAELQ